MNMLQILTKSIDAYQKHKDTEGRLRTEMNNVRVQSKKAIAVLRHARFDEAGAILCAVEKELKRIVKDAGKDARVESLGMYREGVEEFLEAIFFASVLKGEALNVPRGVVVLDEDVISATCDMTGELVRRAVTLADKTQQREIEKYHVAVEEIAGTLTSIGLSGKLRSKYDDVERNVRRIEGILYDIRMASHSQ